MAQYKTCSDTGMRLKYNNKDGEWYYIPSLKARLLCTLLLNPIQYLFGFNARYNTAVFLGF